LRPSANAPGSCSRSTARAIVWELDLDARDIVADDRLCALMGKPVSFGEAVAGRFDRIHPDEHAALQEAFAAVCAEPTRRSLTYRVNHPELGEVWLHSVVESFSAPSGRVARVMVITMDVTDRKQTDEALLRLQFERDAADAANAAKSQFLANMSHELRPPLNAIIGYGEILSEDAVERSDVAAQRDLTKVLAAARRLLQLINDVLDLSKIEAGRLDLEIGSVDIRALVHECIDAVRPAAEANGNRFDASIADDVGDVRTDGFRLGQCLLNLLSNAAKFTRDGRIDVLVERERSCGGDMLRIDVRDTGAGLDEEKIARLFQPFMQADPSVTRKFGGTGLGLATTRRIAQSPGGDVDVASTPDVGSTFTLRVAASSAIDDAEAVTRDGRRALVIDDDPAARDLVRRAFARRGVGVDLASDGASGRAALAAKRYDVVVLDINLPDASGWDLLTEIRNAPDSSGPAVIVMSVNDDRARSFSLGAVGHFTKPADFEALTGMAAHWLDRAPKAACKKGGVPVQPAMSIRVRIVRRSPGAMRRAPKVASRLNASGAQVCGSRQTKSAVAGA
jgi:signal transduction histidine kinase/CheY-like chemotaxis protein